MELAKRINQAYALLKKEQPPSQVIEHLMKRYGVSQIQAYRYVQQAKQINGKLAIPEASVVFTVKIPSSLSARIRKFANAQRMTISKVVSAALEDFLAKKDHVQKRETS